MRCKRTREVETDGKDHMRFVIPVLLLFAMLIACTAQAEEFSVVWSFGTVDDEARVEIQSDININFSEDEPEEEKARKFAGIIIERELEDPDFETRVYFKLGSIAYKNGCWYLKYKWAYETDYHEGDKLEREFNMKVDFKNRHIVHSRPLDNQFTGPV